MIIIFSVHYNCSVSSMADFLEYNNYNTNLLYVTTQETQRKKHFHIPF